MMPHDITIVIILASLSYRNLWIIIDYGFEYMYRINIVSIKSSKHFNSNIFIFLYSKHIV